MFLHRVKFLNSDEKKSLISNMSSLFTLQVFGYIVPLLTLPYLVNTLGVENFGVLSFSLAFVSYFSVLTDYGFNLSATRDISIKMGCHKSISEIYGSVFMFKFALFALCAIFYFSIILCFSRFTSELIVFNYAFLLVVGQTFFPAWFFQGVQKMKYITIINVISKTLAAVSLFVFIKQPADTYKVHLLNGAFSIGATLFAIMIIKYQFDVSIKFHSLSAIMKCAQNGFSLFCVSAMANVISSSGVFMLGIMSTNSVVGYYSAFERLTKAFLSIFSPINQALFPLVSKKIYEERSSMVRLLVYICALVSICAALVMVSLFFSAPLYIKHVFTQSHLEYANIFLWLTPWVCLGLVNNLLGVQLLTCLGYAKQYLYCFLFSSLVTFIVYVFFTSTYNYHAIVMGMNIGEFILFSLLLMTVKKTGMLKLN